MRHTLNLDLAIMAKVNEDDDHPGCGQVGHGGIVEFNRSYGLEDHPFVLITVDPHTPHTEQLLVGLYMSEADYHEGAPARVQCVALGADDDVQRGADVVADMLRTGGA